MRHFIVTAIVLACFSFQSLRAADGGLTGTFNITVPSLATTIAGSVDGQWVMSDSTEGNVLVLVSGEMASQGFIASFEWMLLRDGSHAGIWTVPGSDGYGGAFDIDPSTCQATLSGTLPYGAPAQPRDLTGTVRMAMHGRPVSRYGGATTGTLAGGGDVILSGGFTRSGIGSIDDGIASGHWRVDCYSDGTMAGRLQCAFEGTGKYNIPGVGIFSDTISGELRATFGFRDDGRMAFVGQCIYKAPFSSINTGGDGTLPATISGCTGFAFDVLPTANSANLRVSGQLDISGSSAMNVAIVGPITTTLNSSGTFDLQLLFGDPSVAAASAGNTSIPTDTQDAHWHVRGSLTAPAAAVGRGRVVQGTGIVGITLTAHDDALVGSASNAIDQGTVLARAALVSSGQFDLSIPESTGSVTLYAYTDADGNGFVSEGDYGGVLKTNGAPIVVRKPLVGTSVEIGAFGLSSFLPTISGKVLADSSRLTGLPTTARLIVSVTGSDGAERERQVTSVDSLAFAIQLANTPAGTALTLKAFVDANGNGIADAGEATGSLAHTLAESGKNGGLRIRVK